MARRVSGCEPDVPSGTAEALGRPNEHVRLEIALCLSSSLNTRVLRKMFVSSSTLHSLTKSIKPIKPKTYSHLSHARGSLHADIWRVTLVPSPSSEIGNRRRRSAMTRARGPVNRRYGVREEQFVRSMTLKEPNFRFARQPPTMRGASDIDC